MVLYDNDAFLEFPKFGITIPSLDSRKTRSMETLITHPDLGSRRSEWLIDSVTGTLNRQDLCRVHTERYIANLFNDQVDQFLIDAYELIDRDGNYNRWNPKSARSPLSDIVPQILKFMTGAYEAGKIALESGFCHYIGGGTHHAHRDFGHGFCPLNDAALAIRKLMHERRIKRAWVVDVDAHKGDGTAAIFAGDASVATLSIHMARGWPLDGTFSVGHPVYTPSNFDVPIESGEEANYLDKLEDALIKLKRDYRADCVFVLAGVDPWEDDELPSTSLMNLSLVQMLDRDRLVYQFLESAGLPSAWLTAGGYGSDSWRVHAGFLEWVLCRRLGGPKCSTDLASV